MKIDLKTGLLVNKPHKDAVKAYKNYNRMSKKFQGSYDQFLGPDLEEENKKEETSKKEDFTW